MIYPISFNLELRKNAYPGKLIVIEGIDGSGKTTQAKELVKRLNKNNMNAAYTKEPTDMVIGQFIREKILTGQITLHPVASQYLFNADRVMHMEKIEALLAKGMIVVMDRYFWSAVAYAIADKAGATDYYLVAFSVLSFYHQFLSPDITFYLDISVEKALERIKQSGKHKEIYDNRETLPNIKRSYDMLLQKFPDVFTRINANRPAQEITDEIFARLQTL